MKLVKQLKFDRWKPAMLILSLSLMLMISIGYMLTPTMGIQTAAADSRYGILNQQAPELNLDNWIDGSGNASQPINLADHRGKVIYLYFFQDW